MPNILPKKHFDLSTIWFGIFILLMIITYWKDIPIINQIPLITLAIILMGFYGKILSFVKKHLSFVSEFVILAIPILVSILLFYFFLEYKIKINYYWLALVGLAGMLPLVYTYSSNLAAIISFLVFFLGSTMFFQIYSFGGIILKLLSWLCLCGFIFGIAELAQLNEKFKDASRLWKGASVTIAAIIFLILTINIFDNYNYFDIGVYIYNSLYAHGLFLLIFYLLTVGILLYNAIYSFFRTKSLHWENCTAFISVFFPTISFLLIDNYFVTNPPMFYTVAYDNAILILFNAFFIFFVLFLAFYGRIRKNNRLLSFSFVLIALLLISKYFNDYLRFLEF